MSTQYFIDLKLNASYNEETIGHILQHGEMLGFSYYDASKGIGTDSIIPSAKDATKIFIKSIEDKYEDGSILRVKVDDNTYAFLNFYKSEEGWFTVSLGGFGSPKRKDFEGSVYHIDFDHYIRLALDLCKDFAIVELKTETL